MNSISSGGRLGWISRLSCRVRRTFTGRFRHQAARAACCCTTMSFLAPKAPPTIMAVTWNFSSGMPSIREHFFRDSYSPWSPQ